MLDTHSPQPDFNQNQGRLPTPGVDKPETTTATAKPQSPTSPSASVPPETSPYSSTTDSHAYLNQSSTAPADQPRPEGMLPRGSSYPLQKEIDALRHSVARNSHRLTEDISQVRSLAKWTLGGIAAIAIVLGGFLVGVFFNLQTRQAALQSQYEQLAGQVNSLEDPQEDASNTQLQQLQQQLDSLRQQTETLVQRANELAEQGSPLTEQQFSTLLQQLRELENSFQNSRADELLSRQFSELNTILRQLLSWQRTPAESRPQPDSPVSSDAADSAQ